MERRVEVDGTASECRFYGMIGSSDHACGFSSSRAPIMVRLPVGAYLEVLNGQVPVALF